MYEYIEDLIFENSRNVSIKLHHRVGRFVKIQLHFGARWILISEITFDSVIAHGNFSVEAEPTTTVSPLRSSSSNKKSEEKIEIPVPNSRIHDPTYLTVIVGSLAALILILVVIVFITLNRLRNKKFFRSPNSSSAGFPSGTLPHLQPESVFSMGEKGSAIEAYGVTEINDYRRSRGTIKSSLRSTLPLPHPGFDNLIDNNDYQEPYQAFKYAPYYSYSSVVMEMQDVIGDAKKIPPQSGKTSLPLPPYSLKSYLLDTYDYAVPETGTPLLSSEKTAATMRSRLNSTASHNSRISSNSAPKKSPTTQHEALLALKKRLEEQTLTEFPRHRLRMLSKLSEGAFGTVCS